MKVLWGCPLERKPVVGGAAVKQGMGKGKGRQRGVERGSGM
jgi:hypothetical protein